MNTDTEHDAKLLIENIRSSCGLGSTKETLVAQFDAMIGM